MIKPSYFKIAFLLIFLILQSLHAQSAAAKKVLIIHSYHQGFERTDDVQRAINDIFAAEQNIESYVSYLDVIRNPAPENLKTIEELYRTNYTTKKISFDAIIVSDDAAFNFIIAKRAELFGNPPVVFCGVDDFTAERLQGQKNITGVNESISIKETIESALKMHPLAKRLVTVSGAAATDIRHLEIFKQSEPVFKNRIEIVHLAAMEPALLTSELNKLDSNDIVLNLSYFQTPAGEKLSPKMNIELIRNATKAMIFSLWDIMIPHGIAGGKVVHGYSQGEAAAEAAVEILKGKKADEIPIIIDSPNKFVFNDQVLTRFGISEKNLPNNSLLLNQSADHLITDWDKVKRTGFFGYNLFENHGAIMLLLDTKSGAIIDANRAAYNFYGYPRLIGKSIYDINILSQSEITRIMADTKRLKQNHYIFKHRLADGQIRDVDVYSYPVEINNQKFLFSIYNDVTDRLKAEQAIVHREQMILYLSISVFIGLSILIGLLLKNIARRKESEKNLKQSEAKFVSIFEKAPFAICINRLSDSIYTGANQAFADMLHIPLEEILGKSSKSLTTLFNQEDADYMLSQIMDKGELNAYPFKVQVDEKVHWSLVSSKLLVINGEESVLSIIVDITQQKLTEENNQKLQDQLNQSQKMDSIGRLAGGVAHDFNNMLSVILGQAQIAMMRIEEESPCRRYFEQILDAANRSADLTRQLLVFARKQVVVPKVIDLNQTISGMLKFLQRLIGENIELIWRPCSDNLNLKMDPSQVDQLLANLLVNARDAIEGSGRISVTVSAISIDQEFCKFHHGFSAGEFALLEITDNGSGMSRETVARIFEPFFTTKPEGKGTGLGLATVYGIVKQNNGFIDVYSELAVGTTFKIYLPLFYEEATVTGLHKAENAMSTHTGTVLVVEDELIVLEINRDMLQTLGYTVLAANSPEEAIVLAKEHSADILLMLTDVIMPKMNGRELANHIHELYPHIKILFASGYTEDNIERQGILEPGVNFIQKPFSIHSLESKLQEILSS